MAVRIGRSRTLAAPRSPSRGPSAGRIGMLALVGAVMLSTDTRDAEGAVVQHRGAVERVNSTRRRFLRMVREFDTVTLTDVAVVAAAVEQDRRTVHSGLRRLENLVSEDDRELATSEFPVNRLLYDALTVGRSDVERRRVETARDAAVAAALAVLAGPQIGVREFELLTAAWRTRFWVPVPKAGDRPTPR